MKVPCLTAVLIIPRHSYHQGWNLLCVTARGDESPASAMKASHWNSDIPSRQQAQSLLVPASLCQNALPISSPGQAMESPSLSSTFSVLYFGKGHQLSLKAPFSLEKYGFPSLLPLMWQSLSHSTQEQEIELLAKDKSPAFTVIPVWLILVPFLGVWSNTGFPHRLWKSVHFQSPPCKNPSLLQRTHKYLQQNQVL